MVLTPWNHHIICNDERELCLFFTSGIEVVFGDLRGNSTDMTGPRKILDMENNLAPQQLTKCLLTTRYVILHLYIYF